MPNVQIPERGEGFQDNATHTKKGSLSNTVVQGQRALSPRCYPNL